MNGTGVAATLFRLLLYASPRGFRAEYGTQMRGDFTDALRDTRCAHGSIAAASFALYAYADILWTGIREYARMIWRDFIFAARSLRRTPMLAFIVVATLALAVGANTTAFSILRAVVLKPLPYLNGNRLIAVQAFFDGSLGSFSLPNYADVVTGTPAFEHTAAYVNTGATMTSGGSPMQLAGFKTTSRFFDVLGVRPELGRFFTPDDARIAVHDIVLSDQLWRHDFHAAPAAVGSFLRLGGVPYRIIGITPAAFQQPGMRDGFDTPDYWTSLPDSGAGTQYAGRGYQAFSVIGRLRPRSSLEAARSQLAILQTRLVSKYPDPDRTIEFKAISLGDALVGSMRFVLFAMFAAVTGVLLIACANVGNLLLSRATARERELAVRMALGASRGRLIGQLLVETFTLAFIGGAAGLALAWGAVAAFGGLRPADIPRAGDVSIDGVATFYTLGVVGLCTLLAGLAPALMAASRNLSPSLKSGGRGGDASRGRVARGTLVSFEIAVTLALVVAAGLVVRSFVTLTHQRLGFVPTGVTVVGRVQIPSNRYPTDQSVAGFLTRVTARLGTLPGVKDVAWALVVPFDKTEIDSSFQFVGERFARAGEEPVAAFNAVGPQYFTALRQPIERGRAFTAADRMTTQNVVIVNGSFVKRFVPQGNVLGRRLSTGISASSGSHVRTIVGVVSDTLPAYGISPEPTMYVPAGQVPFPNMELVVRGQVFSKLVAAIIPAVDPLMPVPPRSSLSALMSEDAARTRLSVASVGALAFVALMLALAGIYAVVSYGVAQRTHELGVRLALGAHAANIVLEVVSREMRVAGVGVLVGIIFAGFVARAISGELYGVAPFDPLTFGVVIIAVVLASLAAALVPAWRATRVDPIVALRYE